MRTISGAMLAVSLGVAAGCGGSASPPGVEANQPLEEASQGSPGGPGAGAAGPAGPGAAGTAPPAWEMDPAKHSIPAAPVRGKLAGAEFTPESVFQGDTLLLRVLDADGNSEREVILKLSAERARSASGGLKLVVDPDHPSGPDVPEVMTVFPPAKEGAPGANAYLGGYALSLELGPREKGKLPGKIFLSLPGDEHEFVAGTFAAEWLRPPGEPPGPDDAPFIQGSLRVAGAANPMVKVGYASQPTADSFAFDAVPMEFVGPGRLSRSDHAKPRVTTVVAADSSDGPARYEHIHLPAGRYLVYAAIIDGPAAWQWLDVGPDGKVVADLAIDASRTGRLEAAVAAGLGETVALVPADEPGKAVPPGLVLGIALSLGLERKVEGGAARFERLAPGRYEVHAGAARQVVEVKAGETSRVSLAK